MHYEVIAPAPHTISVVVPDMRRVLTCHENTLHLMCLVCGGRVGTARYFLLSSDDPHVINRFLAITDRIPLCLCAGPSTVNEAGDAAGSVAL